MKASYLDNAATTFPKPAHVAQAVDDCLRNYAANPRRGSNPLVRLANEQLDLTRESMARHLGCGIEQLVFVPSATYGINLAMRGCSLRRGDTIYLSPFEHNAVARSAEFLRLNEGVEVRELPMDKFCNLDVAETRRWFGAKPPSLVAVTHASNVTGDILPLKRIIELTHEFGGRVLVDGAQTVGLHTPPMNEYQYDFLAFSSHKGLYGIPGSGGLVIRGAGRELTPLVFGGTGSYSEGVAMPEAMPDRLEAGTHSLPAIVSMRAGLEWLESISVERISLHVTRLCDEFAEALDKQFGAHVIGRRSLHGNTGVVSFTMDWLSPQEIASVLDKQGISVRAGLHCSPKAHSKLGTLPHGTVRVSPSYFTTREEVDALLQVVTAV